MEVSLRETNQRKRSSWPSTRTLRTLPMQLVDPKTGEEKPVVIADDDGIRPQASIADLAKLRAVFKKSGTTTAGNSSQVSDGAGAALLMKRGEALKRGLPILGVFKSFAAVGVDPAVMGIGPAVAIPAAVESAGLKLDDIDLFEINEVSTGKMERNGDKRGGLQAGLLIQLHGSQ